MQLNTSYWNDHHTIFLVKKILFGIVRRKRPAFTSKKVPGKVSKVAEYIDWNRRDRRWSNCMRLQWYTHRIFLHYLVSSSDETWRDGGHKGDDGEDPSHLIFFHTPDKITQNNSCKRNVGTYYTCWPMFWRWWWRRGWGCWWRCRGRTPRRGQSPQAKSGQRHQTDRLMELAY